MKSIQQISKACDLATTSDLARLARLLRLKPLSTHLRKSMYSIEDSQAIIDAYWARRKETVNQRIEKAEMGW